MFSFSHFLFFGTFAQFSNLWSSGFFQFFCRTALSAGPLHCRTAPPPDRPPPDRLALDRILFSPLPPQISFFLF